MAVTKVTFTSNTAWETEKQINNNFSDLDTNKADITDVPTNTSDLTNDGDGSSPFATESYVNTYGGKIDKIKVNGTEQTITNKEVDISVPTQASDIGAEPTISTKNSAFNQSFETNTSNIKMDGSVSVGSSNNVARADHIHPSDTSRVPTTRKVNGKALSSDVTLNADDIDDSSTTNKFVSTSEKQTWNSKQDALTFDDSPTENSNNPVKSSGILSAINNVAEVAQGKTANYVISDVTTGINLVNTSFASTEISIELTITSNKIKDVANNTINLSDLKIGDIVSVIETSVPDRWVGNIDTTNAKITLYALEIKFNIDATPTQNSTNAAQSGGVYTALASKQDTIDSSHKLSADYISDGTNNKAFTSTLKSKLDGIASGAEVNVQSDWNQSDSTADDYIKNKPAIPENDDFTLAGLSEKSYNSLTDKPTIPDMPVELSFTDNDSRWSSADANGFYTLTIASTKTPDNVFKTVNNKNSQVLAGLDYDETNIYVVTDTKFSGVVTAH